MYLNNETILDFYTHNNNKVLCQIKFSPIRGKLQNSFRFLSHEHWNTFDKELEKLITKVDDWNKNSWHAFSITPNIRVRVQKSSVPLEFFLNYFRDIGDGEKTNNEDIFDVFLECLFDLQVEIPCSSSTDSQHNPQVESLNDNSYSSQDISESEEEYKTNMTNSCHVHRIQSCRKLSKDSSIITTDVNDRRKNTVKSSKKYKSGRKKLNIKRLKKDCFVEKINQEKDFVPKSKLDTPKELCKCDNVLFEINNENTNVTSSYEMEHVEYDEMRGQCTDNNFSLKNKSSLSTLPGSCLNDSTKVSHFQKLIRKDRKFKLSNKEPLKILRRSERSPSKPKRLIDEQRGISIAAKSKAHKDYLKSRKLIITGNDDDILQKNMGNNDKSNKLKLSLIETPGKNQQDPRTSSSISTKNKSTLFKNGEYQPLEQKAKELSKSITKSSLYKSLLLETPIEITSRKIADSDEENKKQSGTFSQIPLQLPTKEELQLIRNKSKLMQKENERLKAELDKMRSSPPKEVEMLSLNNIPAHDILDTFLKFKSDLDKIYENNYKKDYVKGHEGINHCFVIRLLEQNIQMKMLEKLTEAYNSSNSTTQATLFANALLPEWVIRLYMEKFNFTRQQAMEQIKAQEEFQLHIEEQNDSF